MVVKRVGFRLKFGTLMRVSHLKFPASLAIANGFPFNPTYESVDRYKIYVIV